jgi:hypothetical protein
MSRKCIALAERLWQNVDMSGECWLWKGARQNPRGYGKICRGGAHGPMLYVHRVAYVLQIGPIPEGTDVHHADTCVSKTCVRGSHLGLVPRTEHLFDKPQNGERRSPVPPGRALSHQDLQSEREPQP